MVTLFETLRAVFYTPFYLAMALGAYERRGIAIDFGRAAAPGHAATGLFDGSADVAWGGPMRMMQYQNEHGDGAVVAFAEAVTRDPFYVIGREPKPDFRLRDIAGLRLATVSEVPTPWLCLQDDLRRAGIDPDSVERVADRSMHENAEALRSGEMDAVQLFEPYVEELLRAGDAHIWYAASTRGPTSYTTLYTSRAFADAHPDVLSGMADAVTDALTWLHANEPGTIAREVREYFPDLDPERLTGAIARYKQYGIWGRDALLPLEGYVRLKGALISGGFISRDIPFEACVDNSHAERAKTRSA